MARKKDYYSFDEVLSDLRMEEEELKRLVSAGEIRAFREKDTMRFKAADIERLKATEDEPEEIDLGADLDLDLGESDAEELVLDDGGAELEVEEVDLAAEATAAPARASRGGGKEAPSRRTPRSQAAQASEEAQDGVGLLFALGLGFVILIFANFAALGAVDGTTNALTRFLANMFGG